MSDRADEQVNVDRLGDHGIESRIHRTCAVLGAGIAGARDGGRASAFLGGQVAHAPDELVTAFARHADI